MSAWTAQGRGEMIERVIALVLTIVLSSGCECGATSGPQDEAQGTPEGFEEVMQEHVALSMVARNALIRGELEVAQQAMRKLAFFMEHVPTAQKGKEYARITRELVEQVRQASDLEEACMGFARLSYACGQCHHALDRGPPIKLDPAPRGEDLKMHMRRHYWAVERMWEALLASSTEAFQSAAELLSGAPLTGSKQPDEESHSGVTRLAYEVHDLAFGAAVQGKAGEDEYVAKPGEAADEEPTTWGQAEVFGRLLNACSECHGMLEVKPALSADERRRARP